VELRNQMGQTRFDPPEGAGPGMGPEPRQVPPLKVGLPIVLFLTTIVTTTLANGPFYSAAVMGILLCHEMGHFLMCRRYCIPASLPHFIPIPPQISFLGTLGAVIGMKPGTGDRRVLFDIGIAGPLAGLVVAIPVTLWGLAHSSVVSGAPPEGGLLLGESLIFHLLQRIVMGPVGPDEIVMLSPVALAGWTGLFVTGLNLIPAAMLDGGHITYGLLGRHSVWVAIAVMVGLAILAATVFFGWWLWFVLLLLMRVRHPACRLRSAPIDRRRKILGIFALVLFIVCFIPHPISFAQ